MRKKAVIAILVGALGIISAVTMYAKVNDVNQDNGSIDSLSSQLHPENTEYGKPISTYTYDIQNEQINFYLNVNQDESNDSSSSQLQPENREYGKPISTYTYTK